MVSKFQTSGSMRGAQAALLSLILACALVVPVQAGAEAARPGLEAFIETVRDGDAETLRGVYVEQVLASPIVQQPGDMPGFVSPVQGVVTQFGMAAEAGNAGLLAHNYLAGAAFSRLGRGDVVVLVYGDGRTERYVVSQILQYQALEPHNPRSDFRDLNGGTDLTAGQLFDRVYRGGRHVTLQTCIEKDGELSWGRLFVIAVPAAGLHSPPGRAHHRSWRSR